MSAATQSHTLTVAVLTFKRTERLRQGLPTILRHVRALSADGDRPVTADILVIDNDPAASAAPIVEGLRAPEIKYVVEPVPGISAGRNRSLDEGSERDLLVFIDDDEVPEDGWLTSLFDLWFIDEPGGVVGRLVSQVADDVDPWVVAGDFWKRRRHATGTEVPMAATSNLLLDLRQVLPTGVRFSERLGLTGGEDGLFTRQLHRAGLRLVWCDESVVVDVVEAARTDRRWILRRARSFGNRTGLIELMMTVTATQRFRTRAMLILKAGAIISIGALRMLWSRIAPAMRHRARGRWMVQRGRGMMAAALGIRIRDYAL